MEAYSIFLFCSSLLSILILSTATDIITSSQSLTDNKTLVSVNGSFELGFFSPGNNSTRRYLGIWYKTISIKTVVWVANRDIPLVGSSGVLNFTNRGNLVLLNFNETTIWSSNSSRSALNPVAQLLESGNFVVREENDTNPENYLWQSFDYPCDTQLPGMKLGRNTITGQEWYLTSWKSTDDPARGDFTYRLDPQGYPQLLIKEGTVEKFRSGPWNGLRWSGFPSLRPNSIYTYYFIFNQTVMIYSYDLINTSVITKSGIDPEGIVARSIWIDEAKRWNLYRATQTDNCDTYALCGVYGSCNIDDSPICGCLKGFVPKFPNAWEVSDWTSGCVRRTALDCQKGDGFIKYTGVKLPDTRSSWFNVSMSLEECRVMCLRNCTCMAYTSLDISAGGSGCLLWFNELIDIKVFIQNGQEIYIRMAASEVAALGSDRNRRVKIIVGTVLPGLFLLCLVLALYICKKKKPNRPAHIAGKKGYYAERGNAPDSQQEDLELPLFEMSTVAKATNDFSFNNKLGEGGFGPVYKGVLDGGQEIAVKRLSQFSKQGLDEFMNEVLCIAKLQHRNLVKLLGCCIEEEKMLIYEYMPNKSLDFFIFDETRSGSLNWHKRFQIICGIARGLLYLHQDSRLRIIHRDLKASNVLLDYEMNPKISDFGMARSFGGNETGANTTRVVGTYGYMSPEYAIDGLFSTKSDIFSFGVLVLEIVSGKKNRGFQHPDHHHNLLGHAWKLYKEGRPLELVDASVEDSSNLTEVLRSIHVGLLCVQQAPEERPSMSSVVMMLGSDTTLPQPKQPGFFAERNPFEGDSSSGKAETFSANEMSFTLLTAR